MTELSAGGLLEITLRTLSVCFVSSLGISLSIGVPVGVWLGSPTVSRAAARLLGVVNSGMGAPPVVVGLVVAQLFFRSGPLGRSRTLVLASRPWWPHR